MAMIGVAVVPTNEVGRGIDTGEVFACDAQLGIAFTAECVDDLVVVIVEVRDLDVAAQAHVAEEPEPRVRCDLVVDLDDALDLLVIRSDAAAH